jgi:Tol biopolymer transport system component
MLYVRGKGGGAILNRGGMLRKLNIQASTADHSMVSPSVYFGFAPGGRFIAFSSNVIIPAFHAKGSRRLEVYDSKSDVYVADLNTNTILLNTLTADSMVLETFPTISPDGRYLYYCAAPRLDLPRQLRQLRYALVRIPFDARTGRTGTQVDTLVSSRSVCHPRISPDGRHLVFTVADYGTFPIWHREADLWMLDLVTRRIDTLAVVNSRMSDTYHSWSSNSRWLVFASKRDDGLYGKPYFCYIDRHGKAHKPFVLPQRRAQVYDHLLKSFNAPELIRGPLPFGATDVQEAMKQESESFEMKRLKVGSINFGGN